MKQLKYIRQKNYVNADITKINLDNQSYLNQRYENNTRFFNISSIRETIQEVIKKLQRKVH